MRPLQGAWDETLADILDQGLLNRYAPIFALQIIRRLAGPDLKHLIDRFQEHRVPVRFEITEDLRVRQQPAGADTEDQAAIEHVVEHRNRGSNRSRMRVRHVDGAGAEFDLFRRGGEPGDEGNAGGDVLGLVGDVLADIGLGEAQFVRQQESFAVLLQGQPPILVERMDRHGKEPEIHSLLFPTTDFCWQRTCFVRGIMTSPKSK